MNIIGSQKSIEAVNRQMEPILRAALAMAKDWEPTIRLAQEVAKRYAEAMQPAITAFHRQMEQMQPALESASKLVEPIKEYLEQNWEQIAKFARVAHEIYLMGKAIRERLHRDDIWLAPYFHRASFNEMYQLFCNDERPVIEIYSDFFANETQLNSLAEHWSEYQNFRNRMPILRKVLKAHLQKDYELSVPVACAQIEGITKEIFKIAKTKTDLKPVFHKLKKSLNLEHDYVGERFVLEALLEVIFQSTGNIPDDLRDSYPNRHAILHGGDIDYYNKPFASIKLILVLDFLCSYVGQQTDRP